MNVSKAGLKKNPHLIIFTDLDGTLLDSRYSCKEAVPALRTVKKKNVTLIICSSKTRSEIEKCRNKLRNEHPFISENGGGIFIPKNYFKIQNSKFKLQSRKDKNYHIITLGASYKDLRRAIAVLRSDGFNVKGFGDMTVKEVSRLTGLNMSDARLAKQRDFDEPFVLKGSDRAVKKLKQKIMDLGFNSTQGEFFHIMGNSDKGRAVEILKELYVKEFGDIITVALGDSPNDLEMLRKVDYPVAVQKRNGSYDRKLRVNKLIRAEGIGPAGWNSAVKMLIKNILHM